MATTYENQARVFKALCDEKRLRILELLRDGEKCACVLVEQLDIPQPSLSYHMKILCESGIVDSRQDGKWIHYKISEKGSSFAVDLLEALTMESTGLDEPSEKKVLVEYLYLDLKTCDRCIGTEVVLDEVMATLIPTLKLAGYSVEYCKLEMATAEMAMRYKFLSSPTIRVNGQDICQAIAETSCGCCSDISDTAVNCRVFEYNGEAYEIPPKEMIATAILRSVLGTLKGGCSCGSYELPDNLSSFFKGKKSPKCSCEGNCC